MNTNTTITNSALYSDAVSASGTKVGFINPSAGKSSDIAGICNTILAAVVRSHNEVLQLKETIKESKKPSRS